jgi:hypothetical protein
MCVPLVVMITWPKTKWYHTEKVQTLYLSLENRSKTIQLDNNNKTNSPKVQLKLSSSHVFLTLSNVLVIELRKMIRELDKMNPHRYHSCSKMELKVN